MITVSSVFSGIPPLFTNLSKTLSGEIDCSQQGIESHSVDGSPYSIHPKAVVFPKNTSDIKQTIAFSREYGIPITVRGGGTACTGGSLGEGIILDMTRYFTRIHQVNMMEHTITVDAGVTIHDLKERLALWNMEIPVLWGDHGKSTVGGFVATKSATASSFHAGTIREWIEGVTIIVDTGEEHHIKDGITPSGRLLSIYQTIFPLLSENGSILQAAQREESDDATGYYLSGTSIGPRQLIDELTGSEGTLGIITSVTFRVVIAKKHAASLLLPLSEGHLEESIRLARHHRAEALFMFDATYRELLRSARPTVLSQHLPDAPYYLIATMRDDDEHILSSRLATLLRLLPSSGGEKMDTATAAWFPNHENLHHLLLSHPQHVYLLTSFGEGIIVNKTSFVECLKLLDEKIGSLGFTYVLHGYPGSGHISVTTALDPRSSSCKKDLLLYNETISSIVEHFKGGLSAVSGDGLERSAYLDFVYDEVVIQTFSRIKTAWDPLSIFNPSKKTGISIEYLKKHIRST